MIKPCLDSCSRHRRRTFAKTIFIFPLFLAIVFAITAKASEEASEERCICVQQGAHFCRPVLAEEKQHTVCQPNDLPRLEGLRVVEEQGFELLSLYVWCSVLLL